MIYEVNSSQQTKLLSLPESGMGYQIVSAVSDYNYYRSPPKSYIVYNAEFAIDYGYTDSRRDIDSIRYMMKNFSSSPPSPWAIGMSTMVRYL